MYTQRHDLHFILSVVISSSPFIRCMFFETCSNTLHNSIWEYSPIERTMLRNMNLLKKRINRKCFDKFHKIGNRVTKKGDETSFGMNQLHRYFGNCYFSLNRLRTCFEIDSIAFKWKFPGWNHISGSSVRNDEEKRDKWCVVLWHWFSIIFFDRHEILCESIWVWWTY